MPRPTPLIALAVLLPAALTFAQDADDFKPLFNGRDLAGWTPVNVAPDTFTVKGGVISCTGRPTGVLRSDRMYENFIVELEWRHLTPGGNAGFFVWSDALTAPGQPFTRAVEVQVLDGPNGPGNSYTTHGDVFPIHGATLTPGHPGKWKSRAYPTEFRSKPSPQWNHYRIECDNGSISLAVNGKVVTTGKDASPRKGYLCLESEGGQVEWRNLKIKELPPSKNLDPKHIAQKDEGYQSLYTGDHFLHWSGYSASDPTAGIWKSDDWILHFTPDHQPAKIAYYMVRTPRHDFYTFDWIVDVRQNQPGPLYLTFRDARLPIPLPATPKPAWHRVHLAVREKELTATLDAQPLPLPPDFILGPAESTLGLLPTTPTDFANLYVRPHPATPAK